jgi:hypothetical protein
LTSGTLHVRLGAERPSYQAGEKVVVRAQLLDKESNPLPDERVTAKIYQGEEVVLKKRVAYVPDSRGLYEADLGLLKPASYRVELEGSAVAKLLAEDHAEAVKTEFVVTAVERTSEMVELSADWNLPLSLAALSGGKVAGPASARRLLDAFGAGSRDVSEMRYVSLWDSWPLVIIMLCAVSGEWILRKKVGLV